EQLVGTDDGAACFSQTLVYRGADNRAGWQGRRGVQEKALVFLVFSQQIQYALPKTVIAGTGGIEGGGAFGRVGFLQRFDENVSFTHRTPLLISATKQTGRARK